MIEGSFDWRSYIAKPNFFAAPVSCFKHVALSQTWDCITAGILVEVRSPDCTTCCSTTPCCFWIATIIKISGYFGLLRYEGFDHDSSQDVWLNLCSSSNIHPIGWCAENGMPLVPPKCIEDRHNDWKEYLVRRISRARTIPADFTFKVEEHKHSTIKKGMRLEVIDKSLVSAMRPATVSEVVGGRLHLKYDDCEGNDDDFWCHEKSPFVHPVGWAQIIGHAIKASHEYAMQSLRKTLFRTFDTNDATWDMFPPSPNCVKSMKFKEGMKLEAVDLLNLSTICVATVTEVLKDNYLMIEMDGANNGTDAFCYHASSPYIFPIGFCESNSITLTPPKGYKGDFKWQDYLKKTKAKPAPYPLFQRELPIHGFVEGMFLEAVDMVEPHLICVATVTKVIGSLLRIHFDGWDDTYDQWSNSNSPDLFPAGWCDVMEYRLDPPKNFEVVVESKRGRKPNSVRGRRGRRPMSFRRKLEDDFGLVSIKKEPEDPDLYGGAPPTAVEDSSSGSAA